VKRRTAEEQQCGPRGVSQLAFELDPVGLRLRRLKSQGVYCKIRIDTTRVNSFEALVNKTGRMMTFGVQNEVQLARSRRPIWWLHGAEATVCGIFNSRMLSD
jgi:hypothetical protein